jgi:PAS domain S-box-containing protein
VNRLAFFVQGRSGSVAEGVGRAASRVSNPALLKGLMVSRRSSRLLVLTCLLLNIMLFSYADRFEKLRARSEFDRLSMAAFNRLEVQLQSRAGLLRDAAATAQPDSEMPSAVEYISVASTKMEDDPPLRRVLLEARKSGRPALGADVSSAEILSGLWLAHPVYAPPSQTDSFAGWVTTRIPLNSTGQEAPSALERQYTVAIFKGVLATPETLLFSDGSGALPTSAFAREYQADVNGVRMLFRYASTPAFEAMFFSPLPMILMLVGLLLTLTLGLTLRWTVQRHDALKRVADLRTRQLGASENENRAMLETEASIVMVLDDAGRIIFANEAAAKLFHCDHNGLVGQKFSTFVQTNTGKQTWDICNAQGVLPNGDPLMLDVHSNTWQAAEDVTKTTVLIRDVTEQIKSRIEIDAVRRRYDAALTGAGIGVFEIDTKTRQAQMSDTWHKIMGTDRLQRAFDNKKDFWSRVHPEDLPSLVLAMRRCIDGETSRCVAEFRVKFDDEWRWMYSYSVPFSDDIDGAASRLIGTQSDVTDLRHSRNALEASETKFRTVLEEAPVGMAVMDEQGAFIGVNAAFARLSGYDVDVMRRDMRLGDLLSRKDYVQMSHDVRDLLRTEAAKTYQNQFALRTRVGETRWGLFNLSWIFDKNRGRYVYIAQIVDITDQKRMEQIKSEFVATVSHELRTPLTSIKGALSLLEITPDITMPDKARRLLEIARVNADRLSVIVNDILDLEKISSGEVVFEFANTPIEDLISYTLEELEPVAAGHANTLQFERSGDGMCVHVDGGRLRQVLTNLVSNACKFSDPDTPVVLRCTQDGDEALISVENTGQPIPEHFQTELFKPFTQVDGSDTRSKGGTGLGLNIASQIVSRLGGRIGFEQQPHRKTVFWFTCPLAFADADLPSSREITQSTVSNELLRVLHLEDDGDFADVIAAAFSGIANISHVSNLAQARRMLSDRIWDSVLIDWSLPDGIAQPLIDQIEQEQPQARIIILSAITAPYSDPRIAGYLIKSQMGVKGIVEQVVQITKNGQPANQAGADSQSKAVG